MPNPLVNRLIRRSFPPQFTYRVRVLAAETTHPKFTFAAGYPPAFIDWGDGTARTAALSGTEYTHAYVAAGEYTVTLILTNQAKWLTAVDINSDKVISVVTPIQIFLKLTNFGAFTNLAWVQNISSFVLLVAQQYLQIHSTGVEGSVAGHVLPATLIYYQINNTSLTGSIAGHVLPATLIRYRINNTTCSNCPILSSMVAIQDILAQDCALPEATVDAYLDRCWLREAFTTFATPTLNLGGTDAPPSVAGAAIALLLVGVGWIVTTS